MVWMGGVKGVSPSSSRIKAPTKSVEKVTWRRWATPSSSSLETTTKEAPGMPRGHLLADPIIRSTPQLGRSNSSPATLLTVSTSTHY